MRKGWRLPFGRVRIETSAAGAKASFCVVARIDELERETAERHTNRRPLDSNSCEGSSMAKLIPVTGDITKLDVDAIVNAANTSLLGGGGVDGAIHRAAGPELLEACRELHGCATGDAKATPGFRLPAKWVFHAVGPVWHGGEPQEDELLAGCYRRCLELAARAHRCGRSHFPPSAPGSTAFPPTELRGSPSTPCKALVDVERRGTGQLCLLQRSDAADLRAASRRRT